MTVPTFGTFVPQETGDPYPPKENYSKGLLVKVKQRKEGIVTKNTPEGGPGIIVDLVDLTDNKVYRNTLWMGGAIVDGLTPYINGEVLVLRFEPVVGKSGREYPSPVNAPEYHAHATAYYQQHGDPFAPQFGSIAPPVAPPAPAPVAPPVSAPAPVAAQPAAPAAAPAAPALTPEQRAALAAMGIALPA